MTWSTTAKLYTGVAVFFLTLGCLYASVGNGWSAMLDGMAGIVWALNAWKEISP